MLVSLLPLANVTFARLCVLLNASLPMAVTLAGMTTLWMSEPENTPSAMDVTSLGMDRFVDSPR